MCGPAYVLSRLCTEPAYVLSRLYAERLMYQAAYALRPAYMLSRSAESAEP
jgi:hypothetical protein